MAFLVEDGSGVIGANSLMTVAEVTTYLTDRARNTAWDAATTADQQAALIEATDYIEQRFSSRFKGQQSVSCQKYARGQLVFTAQPSATDIVTIGSTVYTFQTTLSSAYDVLIGTNIDDTLTNLARAIIADADYAGDDFHAGTVAHPDVTAATTYGLAILVTADFIGEDGNNIASTTDVTGATWTSATLLGGNDRGLTQSLSFPRDYLYDRTGSVVIGVPEKVKWAVAEYASRALSATLLSDPTVDATGNAVQSKFEKVGPLETKTSYFGGGTQTLGVYPAADQFLVEFLYPRGVTFK